jgi:outer membrane receptor protein involved in Fe transport
MNMIPTALVGRIETVTGGASATYGADAIAGVVNVILDNNIEGLRVDLSYNTTDAGDGDSYNLSLGTGFEVLDRRGRIQVGYDHSNQDPIDNCTSREFCARNWGLMNQYTGNNFFPIAGTPMTSLLDPSQPQYIIREGMRYTRTPEGVSVGTGTAPTDPNLYILPANQVIFATHATTAAAAVNVGSYTFSADGKSLVPYLDHLSTIDRGFVHNKGGGGTTPFGGGSSIYLNVPMLPETERDNLFTRFSYDFEGGIRLTSSFTYSETNSLSKQNSVRQTGMAVGCILPTNGFLSTQHGADPYLREMMNDRRVNSAPNFDAIMGGSGVCRPGPYLGNINSDNALPDPQELYDFPENGGTTGINKAMHPFLNRFNDTDTNTTNFTLGATGDLFEGGSWTWDASINWGASERETQIMNQQSARRLEMSTHSLWDPTQNRVVCAIDSNEPYSVQGGEGPGLVAAYSTGPVGTSTQFDTMGAYWSARWQEYIRRSINGGVADPGYEDLALTYFNNIAGREPGTDPCAPYNPFGSQPSTESIRYIWPSIRSGSENTQEALSVSFSGDIGEGIGAGPFRMAAGMDFRTNESLNYGNPNAYTARDFAITFGFADDWKGVTDTTEAFVEFDLPLLRDKTAVDYLMLNVAGRQTENTTQRLEGTQDVLTQKSTRDIESWKASMVWQPIDLMRVRITRSNDTRAPSAQELYQTSRQALNTGGNSEQMSFFRINDPLTANDDRLDYVEIYGDGGNSQLSEETSLTQTLGVVFTPVELLSGLQISVDYYETDIKGGIENIGAIGMGTTVDDLCGQELLGNGFDAESTVYCPNITFNEEDGTQPALITAEMITAWQPFSETELVLDDPNPMLPYSNIETIAASSRNTSPYLSRGIDISASYNTQLSGGGFINARVIASRALEQTVDTTSGGNAGFNFQGGQSTRDVSGQTGSNGLAGGFAGSINLNYTPTPRISGNMFMTYRKNAFAFTSQLRYIGTGRLNTLQNWIGPGESAISANGLWYYTPGYHATVTEGNLPSWATLNLTFEYDFSRSGLSFDRFEALSVYMDIDNVGNRAPDFFSGTGAGGVNTTYFSGIGRQYELGVRMEF